MRGPPAVHVIDDDAAVRDSLATVLGSAGLSVAAYGSASAFLEDLDTAQAGCVLTDVRMPGISGLDLLRQLSERRAQFMVIVLTGAADVPMAVEALKLGALDFLEKPVDPDTLIATVRMGLRRLQADSDRSLRRSESAERLAGLSARESEVLGGLLEGWSNKEIARHLEISPRTVEAYRANLMMKMRVESLSELVRVTIEARAGD